MSVSTVCIIDDDPIYVFTTSRTLHNLGFCEDVVVYKDGKEAYEGLCALISENGNLPNLILLDLNMPVWDGWDFLKEFSKLEGGREIPIFVVSSSDHPDDLDRAEKDEAVHGVLLKPLTREKLNEVFRESGMEKSKG